jgi:hypothetical protein
VIRVICMLISLAGLASVAYADHCPILMNQVDSAFASAARNEVDVEDVIRHRTAGGAAHAAGDHVTAVEELTFALIALGIEKVYTTPISAELPVSH